MSQKYKLKFIENSLDEIVESLYNTAASNDKKKHRIDEFDIGYITRRYRDFSMKKEHRILFLYTLTNFILVDLKRYRLESAPLNKTTENIKKNINRLIKLKILILGRAKQDEIRIAPSWVMDDPHKYISC